MFKRALSFVCAALLLPMAAMAGQTPSVATLPDYVLGPGDAITETVINHLEFSAPYVVPNGGIVVFPVAGAVNVNGMTIKQLTELLTKDLKKELLNPRVSIVLRFARIQQVFVYGDVMKPGPVLVVPGLKLSDAFNTAGGLSQDFKISEAEVTYLPRNGTKMVSPLSDVLSSQGTSNPILQDGDTVNVNAGWFLCYVIGQVNLPGPQHMKRGAGLMQAIAAAGGVTPQGAFSKVQVTHMDKSVEVVDLVPMLVRGQHVKLPDLHSGDLITIPVNQDNFSILGYVKTPGVFAIPQGKTFTLADAVSAANGQSKEFDMRARLSQVRVVHKQGSGQQLYTYNLGKYLAKGDATQNPTITAGDIIYVPETNQVSAPTLAQILQGVGLGYYFGIQH